MVAKNSDTQLCVSHIHNAFLLRVYQRVSIHYIRFCTIFH